MDDVKHQAAPGPGTPDAAAPAPSVPGRPRVLGFPLPLVQRLLWHPVRWYVHREFPRFGHLVNWWGVARQAEWDGAPTVVVRDRVHGFKMRLDLSDFHQRLDYFFGCCTELAILGLLKRALRPGDAVVDGGANIGLITMSAAARVGPGGCVDAFEPFEGVYRWLSWHVRENHLSQVRTHRLGLSDVDETLTFRLPDEANLAAGTLGPLPDRYGGRTRASDQAAVVRGDDVLDPSDRRPLFVKLDVEGFETRALRGLLGTVRRRLPAVVAEINNEMLGINGTSAVELDSLLSPLGYTAWALDRAGFRGRHRLSLHPLRQDQIWMDKDVLWLHPHGPHWERLKPCMQPPGRYWLHHRHARGTPH